MFRLSQGHHVLHINYFSSYQAISGHQELLLQGQTWHQCTTNILLSCLCLMRFHKFPHSHSFAPPDPLPMLNVDLSKSERATSNDSMLHETSNKVHFLYVRLHRNASRSPKHNWSIVWTLLHADTPWNLYSDTRALHLHGLMFVHYNRQHHKENIFFLQLTTISCPTHLMPHYNFIDLPKDCMVLQTIHISTCICTITYLHTQLTSSHSSQISTLTYSVIVPSCLQCNIPLWGILHPIHSQFNSSVNLY